MSDLTTDNQLASPACDEADRLHVQSTCMTELTVDGTEPYGDHHWDDDNSCVCPACGHTATVAAFEIHNTKRREP